MRRAFFWLLAFVASLFIMMLVEPELAARLIRTLSGN